jgi:formate-dependent nitrite reductase membrane component NrfD
MTARLENQERARLPRAESNQGAQPAPPIKPATWEWYIPIYFWAGGISAGSWLAATAEDLAGEGDRDVIRAGRYLALGGVLAGTGLLIADLGRPDRFLNMLRIVKTRSAMSLGAWGLALYGGITGLGGLLQAGEDGLFGRQRWLRRLSRGSAGRAVHLIGLPAALFVGGYTGVLLASTSTPSWARRSLLLGPLFLASAISSGLSAVSLTLEAAGRLDRSAHRRLAGAEAAALTAELTLALRSRSGAKRMASARKESPSAGVLGRLAIAGGMAAPLLLWGAQIRSRRKRARTGLFSGILTLAGSLALRYAVTHEGYRSARTGADTWQHTQPKHAF